MKKMTILSLIIITLCTTSVTHSNDELPVGSYDETCDSCSITKTTNNQSTLTCRCQKTHANWRIIWANPEVELSPCNSNPRDLSCYECDNINGQLRCDKR